MIRTASVVAIAVALPAASQSTTFEIPMPPLGQEFFFDSGFIPGSTDFAGGIVIDARVTLSITVNDLLPGDGRNNGAEFFRTEIVFPVDIDPATPGVQAFATVIDGAAEGWSGAGTFTIDRAIPELIGGEWLAPFFFTATSFNGDGDQNIVNLAEPLNANINQLVIDDGYFLTVAVPTPASAGLFGFAGLAATRRRR